MSDITDIERALSERLEEVCEELEALENERDRLRRALRALRDEPAPQVSCPGCALSHAPPWQPGRLRR
jgi:anti-sigma factor RsiW